MVAHHAERVPEAHHQVVPVMFFDGPYEERYDLIPGVDYDISEPLHCEIVADCTNEACGLDAEQALYCSEHRHLQKVQERE